MAELTAATEAYYVGLLEFVAAAASTYLSGVPAELGQRDTQSWGQALTAGRVTEQQYLAHRIEQLEFVVARLRQLAEIQSPPLLRWVNDVPHLIVSD